LPVTVGDLTPGWLSSSLAVKIHDLKIHEIIHGSGTSVLVEVVYSRSQASAVRDATCFMTVALTTRERRAHERELFGFYLGELHQAGVHPSSRSMRCGM
jgi:hypothetical protein